MYLKYLRHNVGNYEPVMDYETALLAIKRLTDAGYKVMGITLSTNYYGVVYPV